MFRPVILNSEILMQGYTKPVDVHAALFKRSESEYNCTRTFCNQLDSSKYNTFVIINFKF